MRENRLSGLEGGAARSTCRPYPYLHLPACPARPKEWGWPTPSLLLHSGLPVGNLRCFLCHLPRPHHLHPGRQIPPIPQRTLFRVHPPTGWINLRECKPKVLSELQLATRLPAPHSTAPSIACRSESRNPRFDPGVQTTDHTEYTEDIDSLRSIGLPFLSIRSIRSIRALKTRDYGWISASFHGSLCQAARGLELTC